MIMKTTDIILPLVRLDPLLHRAILYTIFPCDSLSWPLCKRPSPLGEQTNRDCRSAPASYQYCINSIRPTVSISSHMSTHITCVYDTQVACKRQLACTHTCVRRKTQEQGYTVRSCHTHHHTHVQHCIYI